MRKLILLSLASAVPLAAQAPAVRLISAPDAKSKPEFTYVPAVRQLPNGALLVNDVVKRQLTLLDPSLANATIVADSGAGAVNSYGIRGGGLIAYLADSSLFVDPAGLSMFVIDPQGKIARVASIPRSQDAGMIGSNMVSSPGFDCKGRLVYRGGLTLIRPAARQSGGAFVPPDFPDSSAIVRVDLASRKLDTAAFYKIPHTKLKMEQGEGGRVTMTNETNPLPLVDDWAVLSDGSIAIVRGQDYHVDLVNPDGGITSAAKIPFDWQHLSDDDKVAFLDSATKAAEAARAAAANAPPGSSPIVGGGDGGGAPRMVINMQVGGGGGGGGGGGLGQRIMASGALPGGAALPPIDFVPASDLPDYRPVFGPGGVKADLDDNLWVRTSAVRQGSAGLIYDVINHGGELIDRVQIPAGRQIVGFGKGGVVYMLARDGASSWIERTHRVAP